MARFACPFVPCDKVFADAANFEVHLQTHSAENMFVCEICDQSFPFRTSVLTKSSFFLLFALVAFLQLSMDVAQLVIHLRSHSEIRAFACSECDLSFVHKRSLINHMRVHSDSDVLSFHYFSVSHFICNSNSVFCSQGYECDQCHKRFVHRSSLITHHRIHSGDRPFECPEVPIFIDSDREPCFLRCF
jgi:KRAB domain-containing zinc finger protein